MEINYPKKDNVYIVSTYTDLAGLTPLDGQLAITKDTNRLYMYDESTITWILSGGSGVISAIADTDSIDLTDTLGTLSSDLKLSTNAATSGYTIINNSIETTSSRGLKSQIQNTAIDAAITKGNLTETTSNILTITGGTGAVLGSGLTIKVQQATTALPGYLSSTDWNTFNGKLDYTSAGCLTNPVLTDNGSGNVTVASLDVVLFNNSTFIKPALKYTVAALTQTLTDQVVNYIVADYNSGTPILKVITDVSLINESDVIPVFTIYRNGSELHTTNWDSLAKGLSSKLHYSIVKTQRYRRENGLALSEYGTRNIKLTAGIVWIGADSVSLAEINTATDNILYFERTGGAWVESLITQYNNSQYSNGTNTISLTANRYAVNWLYRGVESEKHLYMVLGSGDYKLNEAQVSQPPSNLPLEITSHAILVGRIIVLNGASTATQIDSAFSVSFTSTAGTIHNDLSGLQGGTTNEYYHLTNAQYTIATQAATTALSGYLTSADWNTFNNKQAALTNPITGTGTNGYVAYFSGISTITSEQYLSVARGGTGLGTVPAGQLIYGNSASALKSSSSLYYNSTGLSIGSSSPDTEGLLTTYSTGKNPLMVSLTDVNARAPGFLMKRTTDTAASAWYMYMPSSTTRLDFYNSTLSGTAMTILATGNVGIGILAPIGKLHTLVEGGYNFSDLEVNSSTSPSHSPIIRLKRSNGTNASKTNIVNGDRVGAITAEAWTLSNTYYDSTASIEFKINGTVTNDWAPTDIIFNTGTASPIAEKMRIKNNGYVGIGTSAPATDFHVHNASTYMFARLSSAGDTSAVGLDFYQGSTAKARIGWDDDAGYLRFDAYESNSGIKFFSTSSGGTLTERMKIASDGKIGIGITAPNEKLHIDAGTGGYSYLQFTNGTTSGTGSNNGLYIGLSYNAAVIMNNYSGTQPSRFMNNGSDTLIMGSNNSLTALPTYSKTVGATNRDLYIDDTGLIGYVSSSLRYKTKITPYETPLKKIVKLQPVEFDYKDGRGHDYGLIAEEVHKLFPEIISYNSEGKVETISYSKIPIILINAIKELKKEIDQLKIRLG